ncbi:MAG: aminotransferase class V-fold PLP-dependent enzyme [Chlorobi bacterium]|nr:aminotransferase class V-fold PLP-dependent enzyme [Chlorobiota bacterium]
MNKNEIRNTFPHIGEGAVYFNHASIGPLTTRVRKRIDDYLEARSLNLKKSFEMFLLADKKAKLKLAKVLNCKPEQIAWKDNVSNALSVLANGIEWKSGDRIILNDIEFPSNVYPFLNLKKRGVEIDFVKSKNGIVELSDIEKAITERTKLISISLVQFLSGFRTDVETLGEICDAKGIIFSVDAIQGAGVVEIDVQKSKIDFLAGGAQKWFMSIMGTSYLYLSDRLKDILKQPEIGWLSVNDAWNLTDYNLSLKPDASRYQTGTMNALGIVAFDKSLELFDSVGINEIEKEVLSNTNYFIEKLTAIGIVPLLDGVADINRAGIVTFPINKPETILAELKKRNITGELREGLIRMAPHFYNTKEEIDIAVDALKEIAG